MKRRGYNTSEIRDRYRILKMQFCFLSCFLSIKMCCPAGSGWIGSRVDRYVHFSGPIFVYEIH